MMKSLAVLLVVLLLQAAAFAEGPELVKEALATADEAKRKEIGEAIIAAGGDVEKVAAWFAEGRDYAADLPTGWREMMVLGSDGISRAYLLYVPLDYDPSKRYRMLIDMHGGVSREQALTHAELQRMKFFWGDDAEKEGFFLALPAGQRGAQWWTEVGSGNVLSILRETKRGYNIDEDLVIATGFSDGGSGSYYLALAHPTPFAGFLPLSGHVGVAGAGGLQVHLRNLLNKPLYITNTDRDSLYPSAGLKPYIDAMKKLGVDLVWRDVAGFTHNPAYLADERPRIREWLAKVERVPHPDRVVWEGTADAPARVHWLVVDAIGETGNDLAFPDANPMIAETRLRLGVIVDQAFEGKGVRIDTVSEGSAAEKAGVKPGDVLVALDETRIDGLANLRAALGEKKFGDRFEVIVRRGEEGLVLEGRFPVPKPRPAFVRKTPYGTIDVRREGQTFSAWTNRIRSFSLLLSADAVDLSKPVRVVVNGMTVSDAVVKPDLRFLVTQALRDQDRRLVYSARLTITVPKAKK